jgi:hypothetical protein
LRLAAAPNKSPIKEKSSSSRLYKEAKKKDLLAKNISEVYPGCLFVVKDFDGPTSHSHTGIVRNVISDNVIWTVEGNVGDKVSTLYRNIKNLDFILIRE